MQRLDDWEARLIAVLEAAQSRPFRLGTWDCALFAAAAVEAQTGFDGGAPFRGRYTTVIGFRRALKRAGFADQFAPFDAALGARVAPLQAARGDIVSDGERLGVMWAKGPLFVGGEGSDVAHEIGLVSLPRHVVQWGWRV